MSMLEKYMSYIIDLYKIDNHRYKKVYYFLKYKNGLTFRKKKTENS